MSALKRLDPRTPPSPCGRVGPGRSAFPQNHGFPGQWLLLDRSRERNSGSAAERAARLLRLLRTAARALSARFPGSAVTGTISVADRLSGAPSAQGTSKGSNARVEIEASSAWLGLDPGELRAELEHALAAGPFTRDDREEQGPHRAGLAVFPDSGQGKPLVQFLHCTSLSERRERAFRGVPPAVFFLAPALLKSGLRVAVETLVLEAFVEPALCPKEVRQSNRKKLEDILSRNPFCIATTAMDFYLEELRALSGEIRSRDRRVLLAFGGPLVTLYPEKAIVHLPEGNLFIRGEADVALGEALAAMAGLHARKDLDERALAGLRNMQALFVRTGDTVFASRYDRRLRVEDIGEIFRGEIDLGYLSKEHLRNGFSLHTTRGCPYRCAFCSKVHGSRVRSLSAETIFHVLSSLEKRILQIEQAEGLTESEKRAALQLTFTDDDFLLDPGRAQAVLRGLAERPFFVRTIPAAIPSFLRDRPAGGKELDPILSDSIRAGRAKIGSFEIGTDDFSERELRRLGKGRPRAYGAPEIRAVVEELESLGVRNRHFVILSNPDTRWSDLLEKLVRLEEWSWSYPHFFPDPNPATLAPVGTPLFARLHRQGRTGGLATQRFSVPGFAEFDHQAFNLAPPEEHLFASERLSCMEFFRRLCDLLKTCNRFFIVNEAYLHLLRIRNEAFPDAEEKARVFGQIVRCVHLRRARLEPRLAELPLPAERGAAAVRKRNLVLETVAGMLLVRETLGRLFPEDAFQAEREELGRTVDRQISAWDRSPDPEASLWPRVPLQEALHAIREEAKGWSGREPLAGESPAAIRPFPKSFIQSVREELERKTSASKAREWAALFEPGTSLLLLEVGKDRQDARFIEDAVRIGRFFELARLGGVGASRLSGVLPFLRAEWVLWKSIKDHYLGSSEVRIFLYEGLLRLPFELKRRFQEEFGLSPFCDRDELVASLLSKLLAARGRPHDACIHGTGLFEAAREELGSLVHEELAAFAQWLFAERSG
ncbi:MAG: hypothetical protein AB1640_08565 [bacterium]